MLEADTESSAASGVQSRLVRRGDSSNVGVRTVMVMTRLSGGGGRGGGGDGDWVREVDLAEQVSIWLNCLK